VSSFNVDTLMQGLVSTNIEEQANALEATAELFRALANEAVQGIQVSSNVFVIIERIARLGTVAIPALVEFVRNCERGEKRTLVSILLLSLGSKEGLEDVTAELRGRGPNANLAAQQLVQAKIPEAANLIIDYLRHIPEEELLERAKAPYINSFISALEKSGRQLPLDLKERFTSPSVPKDISSFIK
jgi:hypothetical protein